MAGFLYFVESAAAPDLAKCRELGLGYAFSAAPAARECQGRTPSGNRGYVFGDSKRLDGRLPACDLENQVWRKVPGQEVWVGHWKDAKPGPEDLARAEQIPGYRLPLADGNPWRIPLVREFDTEREEPLSALPAPYDLDENGFLTRGAMLESQRWLWDLTEPAWQAMVSNGDAGDQAMLETAAKILGVNYVVDVVECAALLRLFSPSISPTGVVALAIDFVTFREWYDAKKKTTDQSSADDISATSPGETDASAVTRPPAPTS